MADSRLCVKVYVNDMRNKTAYVETYSRARRKFYPPTHGGLFSVGDRLGRVTLLDHDGMHSYTIAVLAISGYSPSSLILDFPAEADFPYHEYRPKYPIRDHHAILKDRIESLRPSFLCWNRKWRQQQNETLDDVMKIIDQHFGK